MSQDMQVMSNANAVINWDSNDQLKTIKEIYGKNLTNDEFTTFVNIGKCTGLNPFLREVWAVKYGSTAASIFIGRDGYRKSAQRHPQYDYHSVDAVYSNDTFGVHNGEVTHKYNLSDRGILLGGYCTVQRKGSSRPIYIFVELKEYNKGQSVWKEKPATMIKKVAEAQGLRMAFQELFAGTYSEDEYQPEDNTKSSRISVASEKVKNLINSKSERLPNADEIIDIINNANQLSDLSSIANLSKGLPEDDKERIREVYKAKQAELKKINQQTGEILDQKPENTSTNSDFEKIKKKLLSSSSSDTLDIAADLISTVDEDLQPELLEIYNQRKGEVKG